MNEQIILTILLVRLLIGHLVIGSVCIYRMKRDRPRAVEEPQPSAWAM